MRNHRYQEECKECHIDIWYNPKGDKHVVCPHCGAQLPQQSSEDDDEGVMHENVS